MIRLFSVLTAIVLSLSALANATCKPDSAAFKGAEKAANRLMYEELDLVFGANYAEAGDCPVRGNATETTCGIVVSFEIDEEFEKFQNLQNVFDVRRDGFPVCSLRN